MDLGVYDFEVDELALLLTRVAGIARRLEIEVIEHSPGETSPGRRGEGPVPLHSDRTEPTFRISCELRAIDDLVNRLARFQTDAGVELVLDDGRKARIRRRRE